MKITSYFVIEQSGQFFEMPMSRSDIETMSPEEFNKNLFSSFRVELYQILILFNNISITLLDKAMKKYKN